MMKLGRTSSVVLAGIMAFWGASIVLGGSRTGAVSQDANAAKAAAQQAAPDPWGASETVEPEYLVKELADPVAANRPTIVYVGPRFLYDGGHIPGAIFHGPGSRDEGIADLHKWAQGESHSVNVVLYCGCCPLERCPNLRPAFSALHDMGFTHVRVLLLPHNFATDWAAKGYPVEKKQ